METFVVDFWDPGLLLITFKCLTWKKWNRCQFCWLLMRYPASAKTKIYIIIVLWHSQWFLITKHIKMNIYQMTNSYFSVAQIWIEFSEETRLRPERTSQYYSLESTGKVGEQQLQVWGTGSLLLNWPCSSISFSSLTLFKYFLFTTDLIL